MIRREDERAVKRSKTPVEKLKALQTMYDHIVQDLQPPEQYMYSERNDSRPKNEPFLDPKYSDNPIFKQTSLQPSTGELNRQAAEANEESKEQKRSPKEKTGQQEPDLRAITGPSTPNVHSSSSEKSSKSKSRKKIASACKRLDELTEIIGENEKQTSINQVDETLAVRKEKSSSSFLKFLNRMMPKSKNTEQETNQANSGKCQSVRKVPTSVTSCSRKIRSACRKLGQLQDTMGEENRQQRETYIQSFSTAFMEYLRALMGSGKRTETEKEEPKEKSKRTSKKRVSISDNVLVRYYDPEEDFWPQNETLIQKNSDIPSSETFIANEPNKTILP